MTLWSSWGLSLFVLFEQCKTYHALKECSWGLSLFVLFEQQLKFLTNS